MSGFSDLTDEEAQFVETVGRFADQALRPLAAEHDRSQRFDPDLVGKLADLGIFGMRLPAAYGGSDGTMAAATAALEAVARADSGFASSLIVHLAVGGVLLHVGTDDQRARYLPRIADGRRLCGMAITEPDAGSDVRAMRTRARRQADGSWRIDGEKLYITNGASAGFLIVAATVDNERRIAWFLVEHDDAGVSAVKLDKLGVRASETVALHFDGCTVPPDRLLGGDPDSDGFAVAQEAFNQDRLLGASVACGLARRALDEAAAFARNRQQFGRSIAQFQAVRHTLADLATDIEAGRALVAQAARLVDLGRPYAVQAAMAKLHTGHMVRRVCLEALELHGGFGFMQESVISRLYRDAPIMGIAGGTSNMQRELIGRAVAAGAGS